ncbi:serine hydrolase [Christiangramia marina]|uniref:serine hydrolase n=1 Tax=Christiangramia marina TaxID=409436 RepID=UPI003AA9AA77
MRKIIVFLFLITASNFISAQTENYKISINNFQMQFNDKDYLKIFNSFSPQMQQTLPMEKTKEFFSNLYKNVGDIKAKEFIDYENLNSALYKAKFEKATLAIYISLNKNNKIAGLLIKPYHEKNKLNQAINALKTYPKEIAESIFLKAQDFPNNTQLSIAVIENGETSFYGIKRENDSIKEYKNQDKVFEIGSITKVFTSTVFASLVVSGNLKLDDTINSFYPFDLNNNTILTFKSLANHTSGLPRLPENLDLSNEINPYKDYGNREIEDYLKNYLKIENDSTNSYNYSNLGAGLLGYTLGITQKSSFQTLLKRHIFDEYKMNNSYTDSRNLDGSLIKGLDQNGKEVKNWDFDALFGGGGILSTTEDLSKFAKAQFNPDNFELELTRKPTFTIDDRMKIGLGWHIIKSKNDIDLYWHNGGTAGYSSSIIIEPKNHFAVIILSNVSAFNSTMRNIDDLAFELAKNLNGK